ncbi:bis(5'-nucleosyl)-tetraphosphatase PrpE [Fredinandcohnia quinoae]|uniref:Bis(5'-nucleosyl)-tetraphosphatase PrpE n=1 Tax=Fredinandcohnia quinoae TaxID=2918902 RepID=A0AAW5E5V9_9BACI|nr:bis(5'-nucleosyl)-tetraphosphatase PrpE [Fredinandcohnia sp. SECRCQ15]MCH1626239.1 bis(5'-nucleosyl)-tetraphosphatase PrpE [Fredinandcohnia sp. SECRCQ15]
MKIDIIGDIHGCFDELELLTKKLGYEWIDELPKHNEGRQLAFVGDLTDRGPYSLKVAELIYKLVIERKEAFYVPGNHCNKLYRFFLGNKVQIAHGLETTVAEYEALPKNKRSKVRNHFIELYEKSPLHLVLDNRKLVIAHAGIPEDYIGRTGKKIEKFVLYGDITGKTNPDGTPERRDWAKHYNGDALIIYGHTPVKEPRKVNQTINIDTGAVFGGALTAFRYPELEIMSVQSTMPFVEEKFRPI